MSKSVILSCITTRYLLFSFVSLLLAYLYLPDLKSRTGRPNRNQGYEYEELSMTKAATDIVYDSGCCPLPFVPRPSAMPRSIPYIQHKFTFQTEHHGNQMKERKHAVKRAFEHSWNGYKNHAWLWDEVSPISGGHKSTLGGWGATLIDSLDTLLIMGLDQEFEKAIESLSDIDFSSPGALGINVFETNIRYLGGLLSAYDLTDGKHQILLEKARQLGDFLYGAFDTPNGIPQTRWNWSNPSPTHEAPRESIFLAELGSLSLEFTRLSQITGDEKYLDALQKITDLLHNTQNSTKLPGLWPVLFDPQAMQFSSTHFTLGGMADSTYEYLVKEFVLLAGRSDKYRDMYISAVESMKKNLLFHGMNQDGRRTLFAGNIRFVSETGQETFEYQTEHLKCFLGGMVGIGSKVFNRPSDLSIARELVEGCIWAYELMPTGIMPEVLYISGCKNSRCEWDDERWLRGILGRSDEREMPLEVREAAEQIALIHGLRPPILEVADPSYRLRPEAIESIFILYRLTGERSLQDTAWRMFQNIEKYTRAEHGYAALDDTRNTESAKLDVMESFWFSETLKYFYLIFSDLDCLSLDEYVFNTEGHPFKYLNPESNEI
ncbi:uncharacterized protein N7483_012491 [Penicillium malachiteum]|uniref:uncharacterized protein n=1 Tax=Penicillium malachiteum TaxID=1324776 RepID=UPI002548F196|nr:uncharacterized protein N7483_012491 [Penicillium malachiteum]KAJ5715310.1 hypothetical protein N7483_012491 [Penicillium malachiteum]